MKRAPKLNVIVREADGPPLDLQAFVRRIVEGLLEAEDVRERGAEPATNDRIGA